MKKSFITLSIILFSYIARSAYINQDVYDYYWQGTTKNPEACTTYKTVTERFVVGPPPLPFNSEKTQYAPLPCQYNNQLFESIIQWTDTTMANAYDYLYQNGKVYQTNYVGSAGPYWPKRIREMANYNDLSFDGTAGENSRHCYGRTRFWMNAATNGTYRVKVTFSGGYWDDWFPGYSAAGDIDYYTTRPVKIFNYVGDGVRIGGVLCNYAGEVILYWNPNTQGTLDLTPTVQNITRARHWKYSLTMTIP